MVYAMSFSKEAFFDRSVMPTIESLASVTTAFLPPKRLQTSDSDGVPNILK